MLRKEIFHLFLLLSASSLFSVTAAYAESCPDGSLYCCNKCHSEKNCSHAACDSCHGNPPTLDSAGKGGVIWYPAPTGSSSAGAHLIHATSGSNYDFSCGECHYNGMQDPPIKLDNLLQIGSKSSGIKTYDGRAAFNPPYDYIGTNGTEITRGGTLRCSNTYCHSNGTSVATGVIAGNSSPAWDSKAGVECNSCHGSAVYGDWRKAMPNYSEDQPKSNSHFMHQTYQCNFCHYATTTDGSTIANKANHVNGSYDVAPDSNAVYSYYSKSTNVNFIYAFDAGGGTCTSISCHILKWADAGEFTWGGSSLSATIAYTNGTNCYEVSLNANITGNGTPPYTYSWDFGDGQISTEEKPVHVYSISGTYTVNLTVRDAKGNRAAAASTVTPKLTQNQGPTAAKQVTVVGYTVTLTDLSTDPDSNTCGRTGPGKVSVNWSNAAETRPVDLSDTPSNQVFTRTYSVNGSYTVRHSVTDNGGLAATSPNVTVTVPSTYSASGAVTKNGAAAAGARINFYRPDGTLFKYVSTNTSGNWTATGLIGGICYTVTPSYSANTFTPASQTVCAASTNVDFIMN